MNLGGFQMGIDRRIDRDDVGVAAKRSMKERRSGNMKLTMDQ